MITIDQLAAELHDFLQKQLGGATGDAPGGIAMFFDKGGTPLAAADFGFNDNPNQQQLFSHQRAAQLADQLPVSDALAEGWYLTRTGSKLSNWYADALRGSICPQGTEQEKNSFETRKADALAMLDGNKMLEVSGATDAGNSIDATGSHDVYYATGMSPANWFLPNADCWATYHQQSDDQPSGNPAPGPAASAAQHPTFTIRVISQTQAPAVGAFLTRASLLAIPTVAASPPAARPLLVNSGVLASFQSRALMQPVATVEPLSQVAVANEPQFRVLPPAVIDREALQAATSEQPVKSAGFHIDFDYCLVNFDRPWWDDVFLSVPPGWAIPDYRRGQVASGSLNVPSGFITLITVGMVVIRNLSIEASWTEEDQKALAANALSLGPFCVAGGSWNNQKFSRPGMQVVAWICQIPPLLPALDAA